MLRTQQGSRRVGGLGELHPVTEFLQPGRLASRLLGMIVNPEEFVALVALSHCLQRCL